MKVKLELEISDVLLKEYKKDKFKETLERIQADIKSGDVSGNYESETLEMLLEGFQNSEIVRS